VFEGGRKPISESSATQLSPYLWNYIFAKFPFFIGKLLRHLELLTRGLLRVNHPVLKQRCWVFGRKKVLRTKLDENTSTMLIYQLYRIDTTES
jgi:hypothetical protein